MSEITTKTFIYEPTNFDELMRYAKLISDSDLAPKDFKGKPGNTLIAIQMGAELGLKPMQSIQNIAVINGRPAVWGDSMLAIVKAHKDFEDIDEKIENGIASCTVKRRNQTPQTRNFSKEDAKKANLIGKAGPWTNYESRMLQMRARGFCLRDVFADALKGIHLAEEAIDLPTEDYKVVSITPEEKKNNFLSNLEASKVKKNESINTETGEINNSSVTLNSEILQDVFSDALSSIGITVESVIEKIQKAQTLDDLSVAADLANSLSEKEKDDIREYYRQKKIEIEKTTNG